MRPWPAQVGAAFVFAALLAACGPPPVPAGYDFVTHSVSSGFTMDAELAGSLAITRDESAAAWCLVVVEGSHAATAVAWPEEFTLTLADDGMAEVRGDGKVLRQGEHVSLGGGPISAGLHHSIQGACDNRLYFAAETIP